MSKSKEKFRAVLTIRGLPTMSEAEHTRLVNWLHAKARQVEHSKVEKLAK